VRGMALAAVEIWQTWFVFTPAICHPVSDFFTIAQSAAG
jgi:hypothetical protein